ncbi:unnamed protein product, partial [Closterium sp. NIES-53]
DHFLALDPTDLTVDLLEKHLLAAETSVVAIGAARGTPHTPFFKGCSPSPLAPSYASAAAVDIIGTEDFGAASALSGKRRSSKSKGGKSGGGGSGGGGVGGSGGGGGGGGGGSVGSGGGSGGFGIGAGAGGAGARDPGAGGTGAGGAGARGAGAGGIGAGGTGAGDSGARGADTGGAGASGTGARGTVQRHPFFVSPPLSSLPPPDSVLRQVLNSPLPAPSPYAEETDSFTERREPESRPASPVRAICTGRRVPCPRPPPVPGTHVMALRPSSVPLQFPLPSPPASSLPDVPNPESDLARAASPTVPCLLATVVSDPSFESAAVSALVAELVNFAAACHLDYAASLVAESERTFECLAAAVPHLGAMLLAHEGDLDAPNIPTPRSYEEAITVPPSRVNIVDGMWIFRVKRPPGSPPVFKARYVARGFSQQQGVDFFHTFSPTPKMTTLRVLLHVAAQRDSELHSLDFSTTFLQGSLHEEIWLCRPPGFTGSFPAGTQWSLRRPVYGLRQAPREWHDTLRTMLATLGFAPSTADVSLFLRTDTSLPPFYVLMYVDTLVFATADTGALALVLQRFGFRYSLPQSTPLPTGYSLSTPPSDESVEPSGPYLELVGCLMYLMTCTRPDLAYPLSILARYVVPGRHRPETCEAAKRVLHYLCSTSGMGLVLGGRVQLSSLDTQTLLGSSCEAEIYARAMAAQEVRWLTYLLTD